MRILDLKDNKLTITPELLGISPFKELWEKDKTKDKEKATAQFKYIWYTSDYGSPYFKYVDKDRHEAVCVDVLKNKKYKVSSDLQAAVEKYKEITKSPAISAVEAAFAFIHNLETFFKTVDIGELKSPKTITDMFASMPKVVASLNDAKAAAEKEQHQGVKVRGNHTVGLFEN